MHTIHTEGNNSNNRQNFNSNPVTYHGAQYPRLYCGTHCYITDLLQPLYDEMNHYLLSYGIYQLPCTMALIITSASESLVTTALHCKTLCLLSYKCNILGKDKKKHWVRVVRHGEEQCTIYLILLDDLYTHTVQSSLSE